MKTYVPKAGEVKKAWLVIDAEDQVLGRVAVEAARLLRGKHKPQYTPFLDCGDHVIIINVDKVRVTGNKAEDKMYYRHSGYPGGLKEVNYNSMIEKFPTRPWNWPSRACSPTIVLDGNSEPISACMQAVNIHMSPRTHNPTRCNWEKTHGNRLDR